MKRRFILVPVHDDGRVEAELNRFLTTHRIISVESHLIVDGASSAWSFCIVYSEAPDSIESSKVKDPKQKPKVDYKERLSAEEFKVFEALRKVRKTVTKAEGVAAYNAATNEHLAIMVRQRVASKSGLLAISGVGEARVEKYGDAFLEVLREMIPMLSSDGRALEAESGDASS